MSYHEKSARLDDPIGSCQKCAQHEPCDCPCAECSAVRDRTPMSRVVLIRALMKGDEGAIGLAIEAMIDERIQAYPGPNNPRR